MKKFGIIQPGRLGDIIILLPAAKYIADKGYTVYWPIFEDYVQMFSEVIDYVTFLPIKNNIYTGVYESYNILRDVSVDRIVDVAATFPGSICTEEYVRRGDGLGVIKFDEFKYELLDVPIDEKWKLIFNRNKEKEEEIFKLYVGEHKEYIVKSLKYSGGELPIELDANNVHVVEINDNHNIFYWIKILENAKVIALVESSMSNLVEQLNLQNKKFLFRKPDNRTPVIRNKWKIK